MIQRSFDIITACEQLQIAVFNVKKFIKIFFRKVLWRKWNDEQSIKNVRTLQNITGDYRFHFLQRHIKDTTLQHELSTLYLHYIFTPSKRHIVNVHFTEMLAAGGTLQSTSLDFLFLSASTKRFWG